MDILSDLKDIIVTYAFDLLKSGWWIYIPTQAFVYIPGRMMGMLSTYKSLNGLGIVLLLLFSYGYLHWTIPIIGGFELVWLWAHWFSLGILWYVLLGFKLADRMDHFLDKRFAEDVASKEKKQK